MAVLQALSSNLQRRFGEVASALGGEGREDLGAVQIRENHYKVRDLGDFNEGITDNE